MHSCIYEGRVTHHRFSPVNHRFRNRLFMVYLDLDELPEMLARRRLISARRFAPASLCRADHLKDVAGRLDQATRTLVEDRTGMRPRGPVRLLTQLRYFGCYFSPLNLFYCFDPAGDEVECVVAEVNNTPWGEQHCYVLWEGNRTDPDAGLCFVHKKAFHVSPFMGMDADYHWRITPPGESLNVQLTNTRGGEPFFAADLKMVRRPLTRWNLNRSMLRYPFMSVQIVGAIYFQALRLWLKKCPFHPHPHKHAPASTMSA